MGIRRYRKMSENEKKENIAAQETKPEEKTPAPKKEKKKGAKKNPFNSKKFKHGGLSVAFTVIFVTAIVLINVIFNLALARFDISADLTEGAIFSLSDEAKDYLSGVSDDVSFFVTTDEKTMRESSDKLQKQVVLFLDKMAELNGKFNVQYINLLTDPDFSKDYTEDLSSNQIIVKSGRTGRYRILSMADFLSYKLSDGNTYSYDQASFYVNYYGYTVSDYYSSAEQELVSAVMSVSKENPTVVGFTTGFGESESSVLTDILTKNAYMTETVEIDRLEAVPDNIDILVINAATKDYSLDAITKLDAWLSNGGKYGKNLVYIASSTSYDTPNLDEYLAEWGLSIGKGFICQLDTSHAYYSGESLPLLQDFELLTSTDYYKNMKIASGTTFLGWRVRPVIKLWEEEGNFANTTIVQSYGENGVMFPFDADISTWQPSAEDYGQFGAIVEASKVQYENGTEAVYSKVIAIGSEQIFAENFTSASNYNNGEMWLSLFDTNSDNADEGIEIVEKTFTAGTFQIDKSQQTVIGVTFAIVIPVIIIVIGIAVWVKRRRL